jgi:hypothetical protein
MIRVYEEILQAAAEEAAEAATAAFGSGYEPSARSAYEFIRQQYFDDEDPRMVYLPATEMPPEFEAAYEAALGR